MDRKLLMLPIMAMLLFLLPVVFLAKTAEAAEVADMKLIASGACGEMHYNLDEDDGYIRNRRNG